eukprot:105442_1
MLLKILNHRNMQELQEELMLHKMHRQFWYQWKTFVHYVIKKYGSNPIFSTSTNKMVKTFCDSDWSKKEMSCIGFSKIHFIDNFCGWSTKSDIKEIGPEIECVINGTELIIKDKFELFGVIL